MTADEREAVCFGYLSALFADLALCAAGIDYRCRLRYDIGVLFEKFCGG
mgnify:CR=1 FL=1